jgi:hypothetical protein
MTPVRAFVLVAVASLLAACGDAQERDLCRQYDDLRDAATQVTELDASTATAEDLAAVSDDVLAALDQLQAASDGLYDVVISDFRADLMAMRETVAGLDDAGLAVARPLLEEAASDTVVSYQLLQQRLDVVCGTT